ncbi:PrsW family glutamic-type intramembrane protease [Nocardioides ferulae]|uniref:PrsW family glutamic-type intramembrane protease n=1 Tax=Nocardioides ferulae TaxID=2340821 RepID=UPI000F862E61|nr:PrsW family glutamic-type intramembrane protease [Nocardioides ferulae]
MTCPKCSTGNPEVAFFCHRCGSSLKGSASGRAGTYAVQSSEGVNQFALISTIMPHTNRETADNYRWAMIVSAVLIVAATAFGLLPVAVAAAAFLIPLAYLVYIYDVNLWEDAPAPVVIGLFFVTGGLSVLVSLVFYRWVFDDQFASFGPGSARGGIESLSIPALLIFAVLLPVVAELVKNLPGALLARMPQFDDMIDGLTFGVAAGTAYAAFETLVVFSSIFTDGEFRTENGLATWMVVIVNLMVVKSLVYGTATGIAVAAFSGKGEGYDGFTAYYVKNLAFAMGANVLYWLGVRFAAYLPYGQALGLIWGFVVLAVLVIRIRVMLQAALLEAAIEDAAKEGHSKRDTFVETFCPECENMLLVGAQFCIACGSSVRSTSHQARRHMHPAEAVPQASETTEGGVA